MDNQDQLFGKLLLKLLLLQMLLLYYQFLENTYSTWESGETDVKSEYLPKIAELLKVEIKDLFETKSSRVEITQTVTDNKDNSINGLVFVLTDEKSIQELVSVLKRNIQK